MKKAPVKLLDK